MKLPLAPLALVRSISALVAEPPVFTALPSTLSSKSLPLLKFIVHFGEGMLSTAGLSSTAQPLTPLASSAAGSTVQVPLLPHGKVSESASLHLPESVAAHLPSAVQASFSVQGSPSSHLPPAAMGSFLHVLLNEPFEVQLSSVHGLSSSQALAGPSHLPAAHLVPVVQASSSVQLSPSLVASASDSQTPALQPLSLVQLLPSEQLVPSALLVASHLPPLHSSSVHELPSVQ